MLFIYSRSTTQTRAWWEYGLETKDGRRGSRWEVILTLKERKKQKQKNCSELKRRKQWVRWSSSISTQTEGTKNSPSSPEDQDLRSSPGLRGQSESVRFSSGLDRTCPPAWSDLTLPDMIWQRNRKTSVGECQPQTICSCVPRQHMSATFDPHMVMPAWQCRFHVNTGRGRYCSHHTFLFCKR